MKTESKTHEESAGTQALKNLVQHNTPEEGMHRFISRNVPNDFCTIANGICPCATGSTKDMLIKHTCDAVKGDCPHGIGN